MDKFNKKFSQYNYSGFTLTLKLLKSIFELSDEEANKHICGTIVADVYEIIDKIGGIDKLKNSWYDCYGTCSMNTELLMFLGDTLKYDCVPEHIRFLIDGFSEKSWQFKLVISFLTVIYSLIENLKQYNIEGLTEDDIGDLKADIDLTLHQSPFNKDSDTFLRFFDKTRLMAIIVFCLYHDTYFDVKNLNSISEGIYGKFLIIDNSYLKA